MTKIHWIFLSLACIVVGFVVCYLYFKRQASRWSKDKKDGVLIIDFDQQPAIQLKFGIGLDELVTKDHVVFEVDYKEHQWNEPKEENK